MQHTIRLKAPPIRLDDKKGVHYKLYQKASYPYCITARPGELRSSSLILNCNLGEWSDNTECEWGSKFGMDVMLTRMT